MVDLVTQRGVDLARVIYDTARGLALEAQGPGGVFPVRFDRPFQAATLGELELAATRPRVRVRDVDAGGLVVGVELVIRDVRYLVAETQPGDNGELELVLEVA